MSNVTIVGLKYDTNLGDGIIGSSLKYLIDETHNVKSNYIDLKGRFDYDKSNFNRNIVEKFFNKIGNKLKNQNLSYFFKKIGFSRLGKKIYKFYQKELNDSDVIILAGGGIVECEHYDCYLYLNKLIKYCEDNNKIVIFNAVGFNGEFKQNKKYQVLIDVLNSKCVKTITVRENPNEMFKYINYVPKLVCDPGCYSSEAYNINKDLNSKLIGINVIRSGVFKEFGSNIFEDYLINLYIDVINGLSSKGYEYELFTNGAKSDYDIALKIQSKLNNKINISQPYTPEQFMEILSHYKAILASRMHAAICSYSLNIPSVCLCWNVKIKHFYTNNDYLNRCIEIKDLKSEIVLDRLLSIIDKDCTNNQRAIFKQSIVDAIKNDYKL